MKLIGLLAALILAAAPAARAAPTAHAAHVGFEALTIANGAEKPLVIGVWYPTDAAASPRPFGAFVQTVALGAAPTGSNLPLIVMSHGTGGSYEEHIDTSLALARAGFVVAAVDHAGDTHDDQSGAVAIWRRTGHIHRLIDYMLAEWPRRAAIDPARIGMFGFSAGGFTTLVIAGAIPDLGQVAPHCQAHPEAFECALVKKSGADVATLLGKLPASAWVHDARVKAAVVAAPALGYAFGREGLKNVRIPIQLWRAEDDHLLPNPYYAEAVRADLPQPPEFHLARNADHFDFLAPCTDILRHVAPVICVSRPGFDREAFHATFDRDVVVFFKAKLR